MKSLQAHAGVGIGIEILVCVLDLEFDVVDGIPVDVLVLTDAGVDENCVGSRDGLAGERVVLILAVFVDASGRAHLVGLYDERGVFAVRCLGTDGADERVDVGLARNELGLTVVEYGDGRMDVLSGTVFEDFVRIAFDFDGNGIDLGIAGGLEVEVLGNINCERTGTEIGAASDEIADV